MSPPTALDSASPVAGAAYRRLADRRRSRRLPARPRSRRSRGRAAVGRPAGLRPQRHDLRSEHADEPDPGDRRRDRRQQVTNQFGPQRYALLFKPGTYGTRRRPAQLPGRLLHEVAGLGLSPTDVIINGSVYVRNQCDANGNCVALNNFWRSLSNLTINVTNPDFGCYSGEFWAVSQAAPMRRVNVNGQRTLMDYCTRPVVRERRLHRRLAVRRRHRHQRLAAAVAGPGTAARRLDERRLEPGVLGRRRRAGAVLPGAGVVRRPLHDAGDEPGDARGAVPLRRLGGRLQRLRPGGAHDSVGTDWASGADARLVDPDRRVLRREAHATTRRRSTMRSPAART